MQDFFQVTNTGSTNVKLSDIKIKYWANDTSGQSVVPHISTGGCASGANGSPSCLHQVTGVTAAAASFSPACGPDVTHKANWEITVSDTDSANLAPGATWNGIQTAVNLANYSNFNPGTSTWFSPCLAGSAYVGDAHFALYYQGTLVFANGIPAPDCRAPHGTQPIVSYTPPPAAPVVGPAPVTQIISLSVGLPVSNLAQLKAFADQASDPTSSTYRKYMNNADLIANYSPSAATYNQVVAWAQGRGFTKVGTFPNRLAIAVTGTVAQIEAAFHANVIIALRPDGTQFYRLDRQPSVDLAVSLLGVSGLDNYVQPRRGTATSPVAGAYGASDLRAAYLAGPTCTTLDGSGQKVGIFSYAAGFTASDITLYKTNNGITTGQTVQVLSGDDPTNPSPTPIPATGNGETAELTLDLESATALAPKAQVIAFEGNNVDNILQLMANRPDISQFSSSWSLGTTALMPTTLTVLAAQGQSFFMCSMDASAYLPTGMTTPTCSAADLAAGNITHIEGVPADFRSMPYVTVVGGTTLTTQLGGQQYSSEVVWGGGGGGWGSGGGIITNTAIPAYQLGSNPANMELSTVFRNVPDVSLIANNMYVVSTTCQAPGHGGLTGQIDPTTMLPVPAACPAASLITGLDGSIGGTSVASPLWAGFMALINQQAKAAGLGPVGFANPTIYKIGKDPVRYANAFNDIQAGTAPNNCGFGYTTSAGYDLTTGWGTPRCGLLAAINGTPPSITMGVSTAAKGGPVICVNGKDFTPGGTVTVQYAGVPELIGTANPVDVITTTQVVGPAGTFKEVDNEIQTVATYVSTGAAGCAASGSGTVAVNVVDNTTGISATSTIPASLFCKVDLGQPFHLGGGCAIPPATTPLFISAGGVAPGLATYGPPICVSGSGFTPNGAVDLTYYDAPLPGYLPKHFSATADATGKLLVDDGSTFGSVDGAGVFCTNQQAAGLVTVVATDMVTGNNTGDTLDAELWCSVNFNPPSSGDLSGCGL